MTSQLRGRGFEIAILGLDILCFIILFDQGAGWPIFLTAVAAVTAASLLGWHLAHWAGERDASRTDLPTPGDGTPSWIGLLPGVGAVAAIGLTPVWAGSSGYIIVLMAILSAGGGLYAGFKSQIEVTPRPTTSQLVTTTRRAHMRESDVRTS